MAADFSHRRVPSGVRVFLLFACAASCLRGAEVRAGSTEADDEAIGDFRPANFDQGDKWNFPRSEESLDEAEFDRDESRRRFLPKEKRVVHHYETTCDDEFDPEDEPDSEAKRRSGDDRSTILKEKPVVLPARFVYVAREFYRSWVVPSVVRNFESDREEVGEDGTIYDYFGPNDEENNGESSGGEKYGLDWRNIIGAPTGDCPPGQRKDRNGRCRMALW